VKARNSRPLAKSGESALLPDLHEVEVYLGVDAEGKDMEYWPRLFLHHPISNPPARI